MNQFVDTVRQELLEAIEADQSVRPTLLEVALNVREIAEDPEASIIAQEPELISPTPQLSFADIEFLAN